MGQYVPVITAGAQAAGALTSMYGTYREAQGQQAEGEAAAKAALYNSMLAEMEAQRTIEAGAEEEGRVRRQGRRFLAQRRVAVAKSGFALEGTPLDALLADAKQLELDALYTRRGALEQAASLRYGAALDQKRAKNVQEQAYQASQGTLIGGYSQGTLGLVGAYNTYQALTNPTGASQASFSPTWYRSGAGHVSRRP